jgi:hypothetical protein
MKCLARTEAAILAATIAVAASTGSADATELLFAGNFESPPDCAMPGSAGCPGFIIETPAVQIDPGQAIAYCYYFDAPTAATLGIGRFSVDFAYSTAHVIVYNTYSNSGGAPTDREPPGTLSSSNCGLTASTNDTYARRVFSAHSSSETLNMPADDGGGQPLAIELLVGQPMFIEMYFVNPSGSPVNASVRLRANGLATGDLYTKTATYMTYNGSISIAPFSTSTATDACAVPPSVKFWWFSTYTHQYATAATLSNSTGPTTIVSSANFAMPTIAQFSAPAFYQFGATDKLTYSCDYTNSTPNTIHSGENYQTDENCVGIGYFFPATQPLICFNNIGPF